MLGFRDMVRSHAETLIAEFGFGDANSINVSRRKACRSSQPDIKGVEIGTFPAQISGLQHETDVAAPAATSLGIAEGVLDYPLVDGARFLDVGGCALCGLVGRFFHDAIGGNVFAGLPKVFEFRP